MPAKTSKDAGAISNVTSLCTACAKEHGATWPDGHMATFWMDECQVCHSQTSVCDVSDWNWPRGKRPARWSALLRD
jgi:hypothetical protein